MPQEKSVNISPSTTAAFWKESACGKDLASQERALLTRLDSKIFGRFMLHMDGLDCHEGGFPRFSGIHRQFALQWHPDGRGDLVGLPGQLPIASSSINVFCLSHVLEYTDDPHGLLREVDRTLIPGGRLLLIGFNPYGLHGLRGVLGRTYPWSGHFLSRGRLIDWLSLLGFEVEIIEHIGYKPPLKKHLLYDRLSVFDRIGSRLWPKVSAAFAILAVKREVPVTLLRQKWKKPGFVPQGGIAEPTTRDHQHG